MSNEWAWAAAICAVPFLVFAVFELASLLRRRHFEAIARRPKSAPRDSGRNLRRG